MTPILPIVNAIFSAWSLVRAFGRSRTSLMSAMGLSTTNRAEFPPPWAAALLAAFAQFLGEFGQRLVEIGDESIVGNLENRRLLVLVDRHDHLGILHASKMLDRARNADRDVKLRRHNLAGLPDLPVVWRITRIDRR